MAVTHICVMKTLWIISVLSISNGLKKKPESRVLRTTFIMHKPFIFGKVDLNPPDSSKPTQQCPHNYQGFLVDLLDMIGDMGNLKFCFKPVNDNRYGRRLPNGSWDGMIGELVRKEADLAAASLTVTSDRLRETGIRFSVPYMTTGLAVVMKQPVKHLFTKLYEVFFLFKPLSTSVWITAAIIAPFMVAVVFYLNNRFNPYEWNTQGLPSKDFALPRVFYFVFTTFTWQGYDRMPRSNAGRVLVVSWFVFVVFFLTLYLAACCSYILAQKHEEHYDEMPLRSLSDLAAQSDYKFGIFSNGATHKFFQTTRHPLYRQMYKKMDIWSSQNYDDIFVHSTRQGLNKARYEKYAYIMEEHSAHYYVNRLPCDLGILDYIELNRDFGFAVGANLTDELKQINTQLLKLTMNGSVNSLYAKWWFGQWQDAGSCIKTSNHELIEYALLRMKSGPEWKNVIRPIDLTIMGGALVLLGLSLVTAAMMMIAERYMYGKSMGQQMRRPQAAVRLEDEADDVHM